MFTGRIRIRVPGTFAPSESDTPSLGCTVMTSWFGRTSCVPSCWKPRCGTGLRTTAISVTLRARRLPVRRYIGTPAQRQLSTSRRSAAYVSVVESGRDALLLEVAHDLLAADRARGVLGADRHLRHLLHRRRRDRAEDLHLLVADLVGREHHRRLHAQQAQQLEHVVLHEVAQRAGAVVVARAGADADVLGRGDLDVVDVVAVPERLEEPVGEAERQDVLDGLLAQVVVDAEDLALVEDAQHAAVELLGLREARAERLLDDDADVGVVEVVEPGLAERLDDHREERGRGRQVEGAVQRVAALARRTRRGPRRAARRRSGRRTSRGRSAPRRAAASSTRSSGCGASTCGSRRRPSRGTRRRSAPSATCR